MLGLAGAPALAAVKDLIGLLVGTGSVRRSPRWGLVSGVGISTVHDPALYQASLMTNDECSSPCLVLVTCSRDSTGDCVTHVQIQRLPHAAGTVIW